MDFSSNSLQAVVAAWVGSSNLGDELVHAALRRKLLSLGVHITALSTAPRSTQAIHGEKSVASRRIDRVVAATAGADLMVLGGGGLLQDETSALNLPHHLSRPLLGRLLRTPVFGVGLGASGLRTRVGKAQVKLILKGIPISVRDSSSADVLAPLLGKRPVVAADLAISMPRPVVAAEDRLVVCLRPWVETPNRLLPVGLRPSHHLEDWAAGALATALDAAAQRTGLAVHFVALQADRDHAVHEVVAGRMDSAVTFARPHLVSLLPELATGRVVISMRYHGGIGAVLGGRPSVLVGYSPKVAGLAGDLGRAARFAELSRPSLLSIPQGVAELLDPGNNVEEAYATLVAREAGNDLILDRAVTAIREHKASR